MDLLPITMLVCAAAVVAYSLRGVIDALRSDPTRDRTLREDVDARRLGELAARKAQVMRSIQSASLDHATGKMSAEDHARTVRGLEREAVTLMREIDILGGSADDMAAVDADIDAHLEAERRAATAGLSAAARARHQGRNPVQEATP